MWGDHRPRDDWSREDWQIHRTMVRVVYTVLGVVVLIISGIALLVAHVAC